MRPNPLNIMLVDDDISDCNIFKEALNEMHIFYNLGIMHEGVNLINYLAESSTNLPDVLFLDLNMPNKNGIECLSDLKENKKLTDIPVIMYSIFCSNQSDIEDNLKHMLISMGAIALIRKTSDMAALKLEIQNALTLASEKIYEI